MCLHPIQINRKSVLGHVRQDVFPCGHCAECRASYQSKFAALSALEASCYDQLAFVTLTYDQEYLPVAWTDSGANHYSSFFRGSSCRDWQLDLWKHDGCQVLTDDDGCFCAPSLYREDIKNLLKRFRSLHPGLSVRYACFGEYGEQFHRPHYHMLLYGFDNILADEFCSLWKFGFTNFKVLTAFNPDGSSAFNAVSSYVSKYIGKGSLLPKFVIDGFAEKPRRQSSLNFGLSQIDKNIDSLRNFISLRTLVMSNV